MEQQTLTIVWLAAVAGIFYFMILRPQQQRQRRHKEIMREVAVGDRVVTIGGAHGRVTAVSESTMTLRIAEKTDVVFELSALARIVRPEGDESTTE